MTSPRLDDIYIGGEYLAHNPTWGAEESSWKAAHVLRLLRRHGIAPKSVCEIGCGAGRVLRELHDSIADSEFLGCDISPDALALCAPLETARLRFSLAHVDEIRGFFDVVLLLDVIEHVEDHFDFLRRAASLGEYKILHIPLDLSVQSVLRSARLPRTRDLVGHVHFFTRELALQRLRDVGLEVIESSYTRGAVELTTDSGLARLAKLPRRALFAAAPDLAVRLLGGYSLLVLAR